MKLLLIVAVILSWAVIDMMLWRGRMGALEWAEVLGLGVGSALILMDAFLRRPSS